MNKEIIDELSIRHKKQRLNEKMDANDSLDAFHDQSDKYFIQFCFSIAV